MWYWLGRMGYREACALQHVLVRERAADTIPDTFLFLEHPPTITLGRASHAEHLLAPESLLRARGVEVWETSRGGDVTYHGPGQLVGYGIVDLRDYGRDVAAYLRRLEAALLAALAARGVIGRRDPAYTGVWVSDRKLAAIGVRVEKWVTSHGFALNVTTDLSYFDLIVPCGIRGHGVTSLERLTAKGSAPTLEAVARECRDALGREFGWRLEAGEGFGQPAMAALPASLASVTSLAPGTPILGGVRRLLPRDEE